MVSPVRSITAHLLSIPTRPTYLSATKNHPFLTSAADGTLSNESLSFWLHQDYIYAAYAYPRFIGSIISHIPFDRSHPCSDQSQRVLKILVGTLQNIIREVDFFEKTASKWGLKLEKWRERKETRDYTAEMARVVASGQIEEELLFLWAMEKVSRRISYVEVLKSKHIRIRYILMHGLM
jgi:thiaminase